MYLTVQRVFAPHRGAGINGALYRHRSSRTQREWDPPDLRAVVSSNLGDQVASRVDVTPGGNAVRSFLDIVCPDDVEGAEIREALRRFAGDITDTRELRTYGPIAIEFCLALGNADRAVEFVQLSSAAMALFDEQRLHPAALGEPLLIVVEQRDEGFVFSLEPQSKVRLHDMFGDIGLGRVVVPFAVANDFQRMYGSLYPHVVEWVTSKPRSELLRFGGVRLLREGRPVWEWPHRPKSDRGAAG
jgi:hypothetical protein